MPARSRAARKNVFSANSAITVNAGSTLDLGGFNQAIGSLAGAGTVTNGAANATLTAGGDNTSTTFDGVIQDGSKTTALTKAGAGTLALTGANTYTGPTVINAGGTLALTGGGDISQSSSVTANGTFDISNSGSAFVPITTLAGSGTVQLGGNGLVVTAGSTEFSGSIQDGGNFGGLEIAGGTQTLSGVNTYTNETQIDAGATLALKGGGSIAASVVGFAGAGSKLDISQTTAGASIGGLFDLFGIGKVSLGSKTLTITRGSVFDGVIQDGGIGGGVGGNLIIGAGANQVLGGVDTYTGTTTVNGTLEVDGALANTSGVNVNLDGNLTGTGTVDPPTVNINTGGTLTPGVVDTPGTFMTIDGNLVFYPGARYRIYLDPTSTTYNRRKRHGGAGRFGQRHVRAGQLSSQAL